MSGFSADWLDMREGADHRARSAELRDAVGAMFEGRDHVEVVDLACGAGSNLRGFASVLPASQRWRLVDHDRAMLEAARSRLAAWGEVVVSLDPLVILKNGRRIHVEFRLADLAAGAEAALEERVDLVTAAALFDLASPEWIARFVRALAARGAPLYAALTYDGDERWTPGHEQDAAMLAAFHAHQGRDKGFGPSAGPRAATLLRESLEAWGYGVVSAASPWRLGDHDAQLIDALAEGAAQAVRETGLLPSPAIRDWRAQRRSACRIGHVDLLARPISAARAAPSAK